MDDLIKALTILKKYMEDPTEAVINCEHDLLTVCIDADLVSDEDVEELEKLSFTIDDGDYFVSNKFGSC